MQLLRKSGIIGFQCQLFGKCSLSNSAKVLGMARGFLQHRKVKGKPFCQFYSLCPYHGHPRISLYKQSQERTSLFVRYQSKVSQVNSSQSASINLRSLMNLNSFRKSGKQGREVKRLVELAKPEWKKLGAALCLLILSSSVTLLVPFCIGKLIDLIYSSTEDFSKMLWNLKVTCAGLSVVFLLGAMANVGRVYIVQTAGMLSITQCYIATCNLLV